MSSFFEKLKKGMGVEESFEENAVEESAEEPAEEPAEEETKPEKTIKKSPQRKKISVNEKESAKKPKKMEIKKITLEPPAEAEEETEEETEKEKPSFTEIPEEEENKIPSPVNKTKANKEKWLNFEEEDEGELAIDIYQTEKELVIQSAIAGVRPENLDIALEKDILTIKGMRERPFNEKGDYFCRECYWGPFSREIILPAEVDPGQPEAKMKEGILTIRIPKIIREKKRKVIITE